MEEGRVEGAESELLIQLCLLWTSPGEATTSHLCCSWFEEGFCHLNCLRDRLMDSNEAEVTEPLALVRHGDHRSDGSPEGSMSMRRSAVVTWDWTSHGLTLMALAGLLQRCPSLNEGQFSQAHFHPGDISFTSNPQEPPFLR